jgi:hypothetical protein
LKLAKEEAEQTLQVKQAEERTRPGGFRRPTEGRQISGPHLSNLNEDPLLTGYIVHPMKEGVNRVGKADEHSPPDINVDGLGVHKNHC